MGGERGQGGHGGQVEGRAREVGGGGDHPAGQTARVQEVVHDAAPAVVGDHQQVGVGEVVVQAQRGGQRQQAAVEQAGAARGEQVAGAVVGAVRGRRGDADLDDLARARFDLDPTGHYARPDVFALHVDESARTPVHGI